MGLPRKEVQLAEAKVFQKVGVFLLKDLLKHAFVFQSLVPWKPVMVLRRLELEVMDGHLLREVVDLLAVASKVLMVPIMMCLVLLLLVNQVVDS